MCVPEEGDQADGSVQVRLLDRPARGTPAQPFIDVLTELVQAQAGTSGFVVLHEWAEILERDFPLQLPDPDHTTE